MCTDGIRYFLICQNDPDPGRGARMEIQGLAYTEQPPGSSVVEEAELGNQTEGKSVS